MRNGYEISAKIETNAEYERWPFCFIVRFFFRPVVTPKFDSGKKENEANLSKKSESKQFIAASLDFPPTRKKNLKDTWNWPTKSCFENAQWPHDIFPILSCDHNHKATKGEQLNLSTLAIANIKATRTKPEDITETLYSPEFFRWDFMLHNTIRTK